MKCGCTETHACARHDRRNPDRHPAMRKAERLDAQLRVSGAIPSEIMYVLECCSCHISAPCSWCEQNLGEE